MVASVDAESVDAGGITGNVLALPVDTKFGEVLLTVLPETTSVEVMCCLNRGGIGIATRIFPGSASKKVFDLNW